jgi:hypothetical protein
VEDAVVDKGALDVSAGDGAELLPAVVASEVTVSSGGDDDAVGDERLETDWVGVTAGENGGPVGLKGCPGSVGEGEDGVTGSMISVVGTTLTTPEMVVVRREMLAPPSEFSKKWVVGWIEAALVNSLDEATSSEKLVQALVGTLEACAVRLGTAVADPWTCNWYTVESEDKVATEFILDETELLLKWINAFESVFGRDTRRKVEKTGAISTVLILTMRWAIVEVRWSSVSTYVELTFGVRATVVRTLHTLPSPLAC